MKIQLKMPLKKRILFVVFSIFIFMNLIAFFHAYRFTHFENEAIIKTKNIAQLSTANKIKTLLFGVSNPRPQNKMTPTCKYKTILIGKDSKTEAWLIESDKLNLNHKGTVVLCHGYSSTKSTLLDRAKIFLD